MRQQKVTEDPPTTIHIVVHHYPRSVVIVSKQLIFLASRQPAMVIATRQLMIASHSASLIVLPSYQKGRALFVCERFAHWVALGLCLLRLRSSTVRVNCYRSGCGPAAGRVRYLVALALPGCTVQLQQEAQGSS